MCPEPAQGFPEVTEGVGGQRRGRATCVFFHLTTWKLTWEPKKGPMKTTVPLKGGLFGFPSKFGGV